MPKPPSDGRLLDFWASVGLTDSHGIYELNEALLVLYKAKLGTKPVDIDRIEEFWEDIGDGFSSAGFLLQLHNGRRAYIDVWVEQTSRDGTTPPKVDIAFEELPEGQRYPEFDNPIEPAGGWLDDVETLNEFLIFAWQTPDPNEDQERDEDDED